MLERLMTPEVIEYLFFVAFLLLTLATFGLIDWIYKKAKPMFKSGDMGFRPVIKD